MEPKAKIGFVFPPQFVRLFLLSGFLRGYFDEISQRPVCIECVSAGSVSGSALAKWDEASLNFFTKTLLSLKPKNIYRLNRVLESAAGGFFLSGFFHLLPDEAIEDKRMRWFWRGFKTLFAISSAGFLINYATRFMQAPLSNVPLKRFLKKTLDFKSIFESNIFIELVATDSQRSNPFFITNQDRNWQNKGDIDYWIDGMLASMTISGHFKRRVIDGKALLDGAIINSLPIERAFDHGSDVVIVPLFKNFGTDVTFGQNKGWLEDNERALEIMMGQFIQEKLKRLKGFYGEHLVVCMSEEPIEKLSFTKFNQDYILELINIGYRTFSSNKETILNSIKRSA